MSGGNCTQHVKHNSFTASSSVISQCRWINCFDCQWKIRFHPTSGWLSCYLIGGPTVLGNQRARVGVRASWKCWDCLGNLLLNSGLYGLLSHFAVNTRKPDREAAFNLLWLYYTLTVGCWTRRPCSVITAATKGGPIDSITMIPCNNAILSRIHLRNTTTWQVSVARNWPAACSTSDSFSWLFLLRWLASPRCQKQFTQIFLCNSQNSLLVEYLHALG